jgi:ribosomal protein S14
MPKYSHKRGAAHGRCCLCGGKGSGILHGRFGLCRRCWRDGLEETIVPCPSCLKRGQYTAMDEEEQRNNGCVKCIKEMLTRRTKGV